MHDGTACLLCVWLHCVACCAHDCTAWCAPRMHGSATVLLHSMSCAHGSTGCLWGAVTATRCWEGHFNTGVHGYMHARRTGIEHARMHA
eukprot:98634-Chlamydomonas_euryale.AAC.10